MASVLSNSSYELWAHRDFDLVIEDRFPAPDEIHWRGLADLLHHADIWVAYFDSLFFPASSRANTWVFRIARLLGIRIVVAPHGGD